MLCSSLCHMKKRKTLIIDNYDSFTFNLAQYIAELGGNPVVKKNDEITLSEIKRLQPTHIIISPGPGTPVEKKYFGVCGELIQAYEQRGLRFTQPLLGVCLGHQGLIYYFGGHIIRASEIMHGKTSEIKLLSVSGKIPGLSYPNLFRGLPKKIQAMRYHSLIGKREMIPSDFLTTAETIPDGVVMGIQHRTFPLYGIQFHPESIGTPHGKDILRNFLEILKNED